MTSALRLIPHARVALALPQIEQQVMGGFVFVPVPEGRKGPLVTDWNTNAQHFISTPRALTEYHGRFPTGNLGLLHSESGTCALDIDQEEYAVAAFAEVGIDLATMIHSNPYRVRGKRGEKPLWRVPHGLSLKHHALSWPDPDGGKAQGGRVKGVTVFELRAGPVQDLIPPSIHPETGQPYAWVDRVPACVLDLPELPGELLSLWTRWQSLVPVLKAACPWAPIDLPPSRTVRVVASSVDSGSVISAFNETYAVGELLKSFGYVGSSRGPWLYPGSESKQAGVRLLPERTSAGYEAVYSHHAADPLGDGKTRDAFGVWALLEHGVETHTAEQEGIRQVIAAAARLLNLPEPQRASSGMSRRTAELSPEEWGEVTILPSALQRVPALSIELLPRPLAPFLEAEAQAAGLPLEMVAGPVLVGAGGMIGARMTLRNAPNAPAVPANLWGAVCGPPGVRKTHAVTLGLAPLKRAEQEEIERLSALRNDLETEYEVAAATLEALSSNMKSALKGGKSAPAMPSHEELTTAREAVREAEAALRPARYLVNDPTVEKLGEIMRDNPQGLTLGRDELTAWLASFDRAGREGDRGFYLEAANGTGSFTVDRLGRGTLHIHQVCVGILGGIQPGPLSDLIDAQRGAGDGLLQRFQVFIWPDTFPPFNQAAQRKPIADAVKQTAAALLGGLPSLSLEALGSVTHNGNGQPLTYTVEAQQIYDVWETQNAAAVCALGEGSSLRGHLSKQPATFARLALVFHALEVLASGGPTAHLHPAQVGEESTALAAAWCDYLALHAQKLWREGRRADVMDAREVLRAIARNRVRDGQTVSEVRAVLADGRNGMTAPRLAAALAVLEQCGAVRVLTRPVGSKGGRPSQFVRVHPQALNADDGREQL